MSFTPAAETLTPTVADVARVREVLTAGFADDPMFQWLLPDPVPGADGRAAWLGVMVEAFAVSGVIDVVRDEAGEVVGAAVWRLGEQSIRFTEAPSLGGLMVALMGAEAAMRKGGALRAFSEHKPEQPYHYLQFLAVHPAHQGRGLGRVLLGHGLRRAAEAGIPVYLESTNPTNLGFYHSMGLQRIGDFTLDGGPPAFRLWWQP